MTKRDSLNLGQQVEGLSTGYDHFRHVYEFIQALHNAIDTQTLDYDTRARTSITKDNFQEKQQLLTAMIDDLSNHTNNKEIKITAKIYQGFEAITTIQRELLELLEHEKYHQNYLTTIQRENQLQEHESYSTKEHKKIGLESIKNIKESIFQDRKRYESLPEGLLPLYIKQEYQIINNKFNQLQTYTTDDTLIFKNTGTSVSNEYYKIEEELVHLLYDIRLFLINNQKDLFLQLIKQDQNFGIARSTVNKAY